MKQKKLFKLSISAFSILVLVSIVLLSTWGKSSFAASQAEKLKIGALECLTGWFSGHNVLDWNEVQIAAEMINEKGGITVKGQKYLVETIVEDGKSTLDGVTAAANRLVFDKGVKFIIGPTAFFSTAAAPVTNPNKVIYVMGYCSNQPGELDKNTPYGFLGYNSSVGDSIAAFQFLKKNYPKVKKLAYIMCDDGSIPYLSPIIKKLFKEHGFTMVGDLVSFPPEIVDFNAIAAKLNTIKDADAIFHLNGTSQHVGGVLKGVRNLGNKKPYAGVIVFPLDEVGAIAGSEALKDVFTFAVTPYDLSNPPLMNEITKRIIAKYGPSTSIYLQGANSLWVLKQVIEAAQSLDPTVVKAKWEAMDKVDTLFGPGRMCGDITYGIKHHAVAHPEPVQVSKEGKSISGGLIDVGLIP
ncbi:MAG: ABC transporter substrate-binding protein [Thermodesulfobacteriota bacterium]